MLDIAQNRNVEGHYARLARPSVVWNERHVPFSPRCSAMMLGVAALSTAITSAGCDRSRDRRDQAPIFTTAQSASQPGASPSASAGASAAPSASTAASSASAAENPGLHADYNVLVLSIDSLRADMPWNGYARPIAPRLTELEKRAVSYTHAYAISSYTSMSLGGFLGGKLPSGMKRSGFFFGKYAPENVLFPEVLQANGVRTISAHAHGYFKDAGFEQGFDNY
jgi:hypothetical protein